MSLAWKGFHSFRAGFSPSFGGSITDGIPPVASWTAPSAFPSSILTLTRADASAIATYFDSSGVLRTVASATDPRIDYNASTLAVRGLLVEGSAINEFFPAIPSAWTPSATTVGAGATSVDGSTVMMRVTEDGTTAAHSAAAPASTFSITSGRSYTVAFDAKTVKGSRWVQFNIAGTGIWANFDPSTGAKGSSGGEWQSSTSLSTELLSGSVYRCKLTFTANTTTAADPRFYLVPESASGAAQSYTGNSTSAVDVSWLQAENRAFATSRIRTIGSAVIRAADVLSAASLTTNPAIIQYRDIATGTRARKVINPWSGISGETNEWIEAIRIYPSSTPAGYLTSHLTVDGPW